MKNKETNLIKETWRDIAYEFESIDWTNYGKQLLDMTMEESKGHDRFRGESIERGISVLTEARYFAIKRLYEYRFLNQKLDPKDFCFTQKSCFYAYGMAHHERFIDTWKKLDAKKDLFENMETIASWDYCDLIREDDRRRGFKSSPVDNTENI